MNPALQAVENLLGDTLNTPVLVAKHPHLWTVDACASIATNLVEHIDKVPSEFLPEKPKNLRSEPFKEFIVAPGKSIDKKLPCVQFLVTEEEVDNVESSVCTLSVPALKTFIQELDTVHELTHGEALAKVSSVLHLFVQGVAEHLRIEEERLYLEALERQLMAAKGLPLSLQPTVRPFDPEVPKKWLDHVASIYGEYGVNGNEVVKYVGTFLPQHLQPIHDANKTKALEDYKTELARYVTTSKSGTTIRQKMLRMRPKTGESTLDFQTVILIKPEK